MSATPFQTPPPRQKPKRLPKKRKRPDTNALRAAAAQLDHINSLSAKFKVPAFVELLSDNDDGQESEDILEAEYQEDAKSKGIKMLKRRGGDKYSTPMHFQEFSATQASNMSESNRARLPRKHARRHSFISYSSSESEESPRPPRRHAAKAPRRAPKPPNPSTIQARSINSPSNSDTVHRPASKKRRTSSQKLLEEIQDLAIDMQGWDRSYTPDTKRITRSQRSATRQESSAPVQLARTARRTRFWLDSESPVRSRGGSSSADDTAAYGGTVKEEFEARSKTKEETGIYTEAFYMPQTSHCGIFSGPSSPADETLDAQLLQRITQRMRDPHDIIHAGCDIAMPSIEVEENEILGC
ncbi:hypothetical protein ACJQWK_02313 [Exserohilum turcicum]